MSDDDGRDGVAWVGRAPCGCALFVACDEEPGTKDAMSLNRKIADLRKRGWTIEKRTIGWARDGGLDSCPHRKRRKARPEREQGRLD